jgi:uncharacterized membrane protein SpoIIM required for sporulation|tara:strand:- start:677 stop:1495 length:819 start_codon:yes stop_codon:yes gene_type:complete
MVFESLINPKKAERRPWEMFFIGMFYSSLAIVLSLWIFRDYASLVMVFLTVFACVHIIYGVIQLEEEKDETISSERMLIKEHGKALSFFMFLFLGFIVSFSLWYIFLPNPILTDVFSVQQQTITQVNSQVTGNAIETMSAFSKIFLNNIKVMIFCLLFSFFYGAGAIFILTWNASVIGTAVGSFVKGSMATGFLSAFSFGLLRYMTHGIFEIAAYFMVGLAGGIISIAIVKHEYGSDRFKRVLLDSVDLVIGGVVFLFVAGLIEVFITPMLF